MTKHWPSDRVGKAKLTVCHWTYGDEAYWMATCGLNWTFDTGTPKQNGMNFCPRCGKRLKQKGGGEMSDGTKNVECANCGEDSKEKFCSMTCALLRPDILEADAMIRAGKGEE